MIKKLQVIFLFSIAVLSGFAKGKTLKLEQVKFYELNEQEIQDYCWKQNDYTQKEQVIPEKWKNESAVYHHYVNFYEFKDTKAGKAISFLNLVKIEILDKAALEDFSEIYLKNSSHGNYRMYDRQKKYRGFRIFKSNGDTVVIDNKEIIKEDKHEKLALKSLEVGDILEYYIFTYDYTKSYGFYSLIDKFPIQSSYPIIDFEYRIHTDANWKVEFGSGSEDYVLQQNKVDQKKDVFSFVLEKDSISSMPHQLFNYTYQTTPYVKIYVKHESGFINNLKQYYINSIPKDDIVIPTTYSSAYYGQSYYTKEYKNFTKFLKKNSKENISTEEKMVEYYYYTRHHHINKHLINRMFKNHNSAKMNLGFYLSIEYFLNKYDEKHWYVATYSRTLGKPEDAIDLNEFDFISSFSLGDDKTMFYTMPHVFSAYNRIPYQLEGTQAYKIDGNRNIDTIVIPVSSSASNKGEFVTQVTLDLENDLKVETSTNAKYYGHMIDLHAELVDIPKMVFNEIEYYDSKRWGDPSKEKGTFKIELEKFYEKEEEALKKRYEKHAEDHFDVEDIELTDYESISAGNFMGDTVLESRFDCTIGGLIKKVGPNYIVKVGQLVGGQITLEEVDMEREIDIYMNYPRSFNYKLEIDIPEGFEPVGMEKLANSIDNKTGGIVSNAVFEGNKLTVIFNKHYKNNYEKAEDWHFMKDFLVPSADFTEKEILLKKI